MSLTLQNHKAILRESKNRLHFWKEGLKAQERELSVLKENETLLRDLAATAEDYQQVLDINLETQSQYQLLIHNSRAMVLYHQNKVRKAKESLKILSH